MMITGWLQDETFECCQRNPHQRVGARKFTGHTIQQISQVRFSHDFVTERVLRDDHDFFFFGCGIGSLLAALKQPRSLVI